MPATWDIVSSSLNLIGTIVLAMDPMFAGRRTAAAAGWSRFASALAEEGKTPPAEVDPTGKPRPQESHQLVQAASESSHRALWGLVLIGLGFFVQMLAAFYGTDCTLR